MYLRGNDDIDIDILENKGTEQPDYGKGKINQLYDTLVGWNPKEYWAKKKENWKNKWNNWNPSWSPKKIYNDNVKNSKIYKILFDSD